jgi:hypothetical protein
LNIWSENNWSEFAKQFNKPVEFPFPGQIGVVIVSKKKKLTQVVNQDPASATAETSSPSAKEDNINFLFHKTLPLENQAIKLREGANGLICKTQAENSLFNSKMKNSFELKAYKCPLSLFKGFFL